MQFTSLNRLLPKVKFPRTTHQFRSVVTARQRYGAERGQDFVLNSTTEKVVTKKSFKETVVHQFDDTVAHFLPKGYPSTVSRGYSRFAQGQWIAAILGSAGSILATQSMLLAIGICLSVSLLFRQMVIFLPLKRPQCGCNSSGGNIKLGC
jgi:hypothetical protein